MWEGCVYLFHSMLFYKMGISQSYISRLEKRILSRLKRELAHQLG